MNAYQCLPWIVIGVTGLLYDACRSGNSAVQESPAAMTTYADRPFEQEYQEAFPFANEFKEADVRSIAVDAQSTVWVATAAGVFTKEANQSDWVRLFSEKDNGPAFSVGVDKNAVVWLSTWNGLYQYKDQKLDHIQGPEAPISVICPANEGTYALGPKGVWLINEHGCQKKKLRSGPAWSGSE